jgi:TatD DNase family protein
MFDTHAHLDDEQLSGDVAGVVARANAAGVANILAVGTTLASSRNCIAIAARYDGIYASVGIHPNHTAETQPGDWEEVVKLAGQHCVVALGETGLDRHWDFAPIDLQRDYFDRHLRLSQQLDRAFIVHQRDCEEDVLAMLRAARQRGPLRGVMHSFTASASTAKECVDLGLYISFAGMVTFEKSDELRAIAAAIPDDRILIETDSPYLSPHPLRGKRPNEPAFIVHTASRVAEVRGVSLKTFAAQTTANAQRLFDLHSDS